MISDVKDYPLIAGPCGAESREQVLQTARGIAAHFPNAIFRAGVWKPRTRPGSFEGAGVKALEWLKEVREETGLRIITEAANTFQTELCLKANLDAVWIGARTTVNPFLVTEIMEALKGSNVMVWVKNPIHPDLSLWIGAIERALNAGIKNVAAIHRGFHAYESTEYRNHPRWELAMELRNRLPEIPLFCDISHIGGDRKLLRTVARQAYDLDYSGMMVETHCDPDSAMSDAAQQITPDTLFQLISGLEQRNKVFTNNESLINYHDYREKIDALDDQIIRLLSDRMKFATLIGEMKKKDNVTIFRPERWNEFLTKAAMMGEECNLNPDFIRNILIQIHDESLHIQNKLHES